MNVLHLNFYDNIGGAGKAVYKLHKGLQEKGINSYILVNRKTTEDNFIIQFKSIIEIFFFSFTPYLDSIFLYFYRKRVRTYWNNGWLKKGINRQINNINPDIVQLNWISLGFMSLREVSKISKPVIWRLSDSWPFTGGCHIPDNCIKYQTTCGNCPILNSNKFRDLSFYNLKRKIKLWKKLDITVVAPSNWMAECARKSIVFKDKDIRIIPTGVDIEVFKPTSKNEARITLNLPLDKKLILFGAYSSTSDKNKGYAYLLNALLKFTNNELLNYQIIVFGSTNKEIFVEHLPISYLGIINDSKLMALYYSAADVFVLPSLLENLSNALIEACACGTPVVAFDTGGNSDIINHKVNGY